MHYCVAVVDLLSFSLITVDSPPYSSHRESRNAARAAAQAAKGADVESLGEARRPVSEGNSTQRDAPKSLSVLGTMFSMLDGLRDLLAETLDGWQPPKIVVIGQENSGKSSVLERLMMTPILPRDEVQG